MEMVMSGQATSSTAAQAAFSSTWAGFITESRSQTFVQASKHSVSGEVYIRTGLP
jgi:hypothetical protein